MTKLMLSVHVVAAILAVGSITVAASMFPRYAVRAAGHDEGDGQSAGIAALLHRICRGYAVAGLAVPAFGMVTGALLGILGDTWLVASIVLTAIAAAVLAFVVLPGQRRLLDLIHDSPTQDAARPAATRLTMLTGVFNVLWVIVVVLMIVRPGSTTGA